MEGGMKQTLLHKWTGNQGERNVQQKQEQGTGANLLGRPVRSGASTHRSLRGNSLDTSQGLR